MTIIILLILAGVSIALVSSNDGIIGRAEKTADVTKRASAREKLELELISIKAEILGERGKVSLEELDKRKEELKQKGIEVAETGTPRKVTLDGYPFKVNDDLTIEEDGTSTGGTTGSGGGSQTEGNTVTKEGKNIKLNNDITLDSAKQWVPIGNNATYFKGTFDGNGKTISGIAIENSLENQGLFGVIGQTGTVKNLTVEGSIKAATKTGGMVGLNNGTISKCINKVKVTNNGENVINIGGFAGLNNGTIKESCNLALITGRDSTGGITGVNNGVIKECYNTGKILINENGNAGIGGIAGYCGAGSNGVGVILNCYNNAEISGGTALYVGGIVGNMGYMNGTSYIYNSYTVKNTTIVGKNENSCIVQNCYTTNAKDNLDNLNSGIDELNGTDTKQPWVSDTKNINEGYPILKWQQ